MKLHRKGDLLWKALTTVGNAAVALSRHPGRNSGSFYRVMREFREMQELSDRQVRNMSRYLVNNKYIEITKDGSGSRIEVTEKGKLLLARRALEALAPRRQERWDRKWRIVMFDIPTPMKSSRDAFAGLLKTFGFEHLQKSVFISPYPCEEELAAVADYFGISDYVDLVVAERISRANEFKDTFDIR